MHKHFIIATNCTGTGIRTMTLDLCAQLDSYNKDIKFFAPIDSKFFKFLKFFYHYIQILVLIWIKKPHSVVVLANYFPFPVPKNTVLKVVLRHPFLLETKTSIEPFKDTIRRLIFAITLTFTQKLFIQSHRMKDKFYNSNFHLRGKLVILNNPVRNLFNKNKVPLVSIKVDDFNFILYPSGYYSHKGLYNAFLFLSSNYEELKRNKLVVIFTFNFSDMSSCEQEKFNSFSYKDVCVFLSNKSPQEVNYLYSICRYGIFFSNNETFGNGLLELEYLKLPYFYTSDIHPFAQNNFGIPVHDWSNASISDLLKFKRRHHQLKFMSSVQWFNELIN